MELGEDVPETRYPTVTDRLNTTFELLSAARRRYLLYYLVTMDGEVTELDEGVEAVYQHETAGMDEASQCSQESIQIDLHHSHLPQLEDAGLVDYDRRQGTIRFSEPAALTEWVEHAKCKEVE